MPYAYRMNLARKVVDKFGGARSLADAMGHEHVTTIQGWVVRGVIPIRQIPVLLYTAKVLGVRLKVTDMLPEYRPPQ